MVNRLDKIGPYRIIYFKKTNKNIAKSIKYNEIDNLVSMLNSINGMDVDLALEILSNLKTDKYLYKEIIKNCSVLWYIVSIKTTGRIVSMSRIV